MIRRSRTTALLLVVLATSQGLAQTSNRVATTPAALRSAPVFFHGKRVAVLGSVVEQRDLFRLDPPALPGSPPPESSGRAIYVYWRERPPRMSGEVRGEFWDLGRINEGDSRFSSYDFGPLLEATTQGRWPSREQVYVILGASLVEAALPDTPTLRAIVMAPERYENRGVSISGRFRGRNLHADLAAPLPTPTKWDFVVQSADASLWISGLRPRGRGFELDPGARVDTGRWLQIAGTVRHDGSRVWIEAREIELSSPPEETQVEVDVPVTPKEPPPSVVFSAPVPDEAGVEIGVIVRIQFSRDMDVRSFKDHVRVSYAPPAQGQAPPSPIWTLNYNVGNRGIELKFVKPLERFQTVKVELLEGVTAIDGEPMPPWALSFSTGR
jgi:Bacterial Ig-like domain